MAEPESPPITIGPIDLDNWRDALALSVLPEQQAFVADHAPIAALVLAKAYVRPGGMAWVPFAFYLGPTMVGIVVVASAAGRDVAWLYHFFIDARYQSRGLGTRALRVLLDQIAADSSSPRSVQLTVHPENERAIRLYEAAGFQPAGELLDGEPVYRLLIDRP